MSSRKGMATGGLGWLAVLALIGLALPARAQEARCGAAVLWRDPGNIARRDLTYGPGSRRLAPAPPFRFLKEDRDGESPKFRVRDARGVEWAVKLGAEAQPETVATRLLWAVGYFAEEAYYIKRARIPGLSKLSRGNKFIEAGGWVRGARFEPRRAGIERGETWDWRDNPFAGSRELNGLKVLMILLNNYDARAANNRILYAGEGRRREARYVVTDLGATLGRAGGFGGKRSKNDLDDFLSTRFVVGVDDEGRVKFDYDTRPTGFGAITIVNWPYYRGEVKKEKDMRDIPLAHARWIGGLLSRISDAQLRQAFNHAGYDAATREGYVRALRQRINQLRRL